jgi:hypothetical protein
MKSRTADGKHTKRFIVEFKTEGRWDRSGNAGLTGFFPTREEAQSALDPAKGFISETVEYRVRMK